MSQIRRKDLPRSPASTLLNLLTELSDLHLIRENLKKREKIRLIFEVSPDSQEEVGRFRIENFLRLKKDSEIKKIQRFHTISARSKNIRAFNSTISQDQLKEPRAVLDTFGLRAETSEKTLAHTKFNYQSDLAYLR